MTLLADYSYPAQLPPEACLFVLHQMKARTLSKKMGNISSTSNVYIAYWAAQHS